MTGREQRIREFPECVYTVKVFTFCSSYQTLSHAQVLAVKKTRFCKCTVEVYITGTRVSSLSLSPSSLIIHKHFSFSSIPDALKHDLSLTSTRPHSAHTRARERERACREIYVNMCVMEECEVERSRKYMYSVGLDASDMTDT